MKILILCVLCFSLGVLSPLLAGPEVQNSVKELKESLANLSQALEQVTRSMAKDGRDRIEYLSRSTEEKIQSDLSSLKKRAKILGNRIEAASEKAQSKLKADLTELLKDMGETLSDIGAKLHSKM